jgi:hypothetical protein
VHIGKEDDLSRKKKPHRQSQGVGDVAAHADSKNFWVDLYKAFRPWKDVTDA